jgi:hypothetical protein
MDMAIGSVSLSCKQDKEVADGYAATKGFIKMRKLTALLIVASAAGIASANPNLIQNGGFEDPNLGGGWSLFWSIPGWYADYNATSASVQPIEIGAGNIYGVTGYGGQQVLELNSNAPSTVSQNVSGVSAGKWYEVSFEYAQRAGDAIGQDNFNVDWNGAKVASYVPSSTAMTTTTLWLQGGGADKLSFEGTGYSSLGGEIDNVSMTSTPAPAAILPFLAGAVARLRRRNRS